MAPKAALSVPGHFIPAAAAELVVEVTSVTNAVHERTQQPAGYACAGVPFHLLVDRWAPRVPAVTLYGESEGDMYRTLAP